MRLGRNCSLDYDTNITLDERSFQGFNSDFFIDLDIVSRGYQRFLVSDEQKIGKNIILNQLGKENKYFSFFSLFKRKNLLLVTSGTFFDAIISRSAYVLSYRWVLTWALKFIHWICISVILTFQRSCTSFLSGIIIFVVGNDRSIKKYTTDRR